MSLHAAEERAKAFCGRNGRAKRGRAKTPRLLRGFEENSFPAIAPLPGMPQGAALSVRAAARGIISLTPSSVAFSRHHSKRSNFTSETSSSRSSEDSRAAMGSTSANSMRFSPRFESATRSIRPSQTLLAVAQFVELPGSARRTRPRCSAVLPRIVAEFASKASTKKRRRMRGF